MLDFRKVNKEKPQEQKIKYTHTPIQEIRSINKQVEVKESSKIRATPMRDLQSYIHLDDIKKLLWIAKADNDRNYLIILTLFLTGRRISEVLMLKQKDIDVRAGMVVWNILKKRDKNYKVIKPVPEFLMDSLKKWVERENIQGEDYVFHSNRGKTKHLSRSMAFRFVKKYGKEIGLNLHPHQLRHSFAIQMVRSMTSPGGLILLKNALEHSDLKITETYLQFSQKETLDIQENMTEKLLEQK